MTVTHVVYQPAGLHPRRLALYDVRMEMHAGHQWLVATDASTGRPVMLHMRGIVRRWTER